jgi:hypothetical protein
MDELANVLLEINETQKKYASAYLKLTQARFDMRKYEEEMENLPKHQGELVKRLQVLNVTKTDL